MNSRNGFRNSIVSIALQSMLTPARPSRGNTVTDGVYQGKDAALRGTKMRLLRRKDMTDGITCQFLEDIGEHKSGETIDIRVYELGCLVTHVVQQ